MEEGESQCPKMSEQTAYPLCWPAGWPRTSANLRRESRFLRASSFAARAHSMDESRTELSNELARMGAKKIVLSTNIQLRIDGAPYSGRIRPSDPGAAIYFELKGKPVSLACDKWLRVEDNVWAIAKHIEALRGQERWGVGSIEQAFRGYMALPAIGESSASDWWKTLGVPVNASADQVRKAYRILVKKHHPDRNGDAEMFHRIQIAMGRFESTLKESA